MLSAIFSRHHLTLALLTLLAIVLLFIFVIAWAALETVDGMVASARAEAVAARDSHWTAEIEKSNAFVNRLLAEQAKAALAVEAEANARVRAAETKLTEMEIVNAALPNGDACGLGRDRVRLLPR